MFGLVVLLDGNLEYTGDASRQYAQCSFYDTSVGDNHADVLDWINNNGPPSASAPDSIILPIDVAYELDVTTYFSDPESDPFACYISGTPPNGLMFSDPDFTGTPDTEDETGVEILVECFDVAFELEIASAVQSIFYRVIESWTLGDYADETRPDAEAVITALTHNTVTINASPAECDDEGPAAGIVTGHDPAAMEEIALGGTVTLFLSRGPCGGGRNRLVPGVRIMIQ
jgi:hypothetical protein